MQFSVFPIKATFCIRVEEKPNCSPRVGERGMSWMDQVAIPFDISNGVAKESQVVYRKHFCLK